ncbi:hypothetical protein MTR67_001479 [Solanum verrucosum]|uniref:Uncharacterized protein n=1 Tax=Solanum verrucosum TaxID=315347 RepID=A0AAF0T7X0_SOLVR|nr:hypothetical protein MTR67_001479 [Solanum verrucosum]
MGEMKNWWLHKLLTSNDHMEKVQPIRDRIKTAQSRQKSYAYVRRKGFEFEIDDWVFLKLLAKLAVVHSVFHISLLKKYVGDSASIVPLESVAVKDSLTYEEVPVEILDRQHICMFMEISSVRYQLLVLGGRDCNSFPPYSASLDFIQGRVTPRGDIVTAQKSELTLNKR